MILEPQLQKLFDVLPLPQPVKAWFARNAWKTTSAILLVLLVLSLLNIAAVYLLRYVILNTIQSYTTAQAVFLLTTNCIMIILTIAIIIVLARAITPLRRLAVSGWNLAYAASLIAVVNNFILPVTIYIVFLCIPALRGLSSTPAEASFTIGLGTIVPVISMYVLFQVKREFKVKKVRG